MERPARGAELTPARWVKAREARLALAPQLADQTSDGPLAARLPAPEGIHPVGKGRQDGDGAAAAGDLERLAAQDAAQLDAQVLA